VTFTRRDIAALSLAYECLRDSGSLGTYRAKDALECGAEVSYALRVALRKCQSRLLRVRLALLLRVLLRVAAGDYGPGRWFAGCQCPCGGGGYTPLWESAPPHGGKL
jgi:hypothetical protein